MAMTASTFFTLNPAIGGQGYHSPPLGAFNAFVFDTPLLARPGGLAAG